MVRKSKATKVEKCDDQIIQTTALKRHALARNTSNAKVMNVTRRACTVDAWRSYDTRPRMCKRYHAHRNCKQIMQATSLQRPTQQLASKTKIRATGPLHCLLKVFTNLLSMKKLLYNATGRQTTSCSRKRRTCRRRQKQTR